MYMRILSFMYSLYFDLTVRVITQFTGCKILDALQPSVQGILHDKQKILSADFQRSEF